MASTSGQLSGKSYLYKYGWKQNQSPTDQPTRPTFRDRNQNTRKLQLDPAQEQIRDLFPDWILHRTKVFRLEAKRAENITTINGIDTIKITQDKTKT